MTKKRSAFSKFWMTVSDPEATSILIGLTFFCSICAFAVCLGSGIIAVVASGLFIGSLGLMTYLIRTGLNTFDAWELRMVRERAVRWARAARSADDRRSRMQSIEQLGAFGALDAAGVAMDDWSGPRVNIDGTPMLHGGGVDIHGHVFGSTGDDLFGHDSYDADTSLGGYQPPIGMD